MYIPSKQYLIHSANMVLIKLWQRPLYNNELFILFFSLFLFFFFILEKSDFHVYIYFRPFNPSTLHPQTSPDLANPRQTSLTCPANQNRVFPPHLPSYHYFVPYQILLTFPFRSPNLSFTQPPQKWVLGSFRTVLLLFLSFQGSIFFLSTIFIDFIERIEKFHSKFPIAFVSLYSATSHYFIRHCHSWQWYFF